MDNEVPVFARIHDVYVYNTSIVLFYVQELITIHFNHHLHAYHVEEPSATQLSYVHFSQLLDPVPLGLHKLPQGCHIVCHHSLTP